MAAKSYSPISVWHLLLQETNDLFRTVARYETRRQEMGSLLLLRIFRSFSIPSLWCMIFLEVVP